jgi:ketopantoate reductase
VKVAVVGAGAIGGYLGAKLSLAGEQVTVLARNRNLQVMKLPVPVTRELARLAQRNMRLQCTVHDGQITLSDDATTVPVELVVLKS